MKKIIEMFEKEIADHELKVIIDNGVNRILEFRNKNGSSNQFFNVLQTRNHICFTGDMGDFVFTNHNEDMLAWFHGNMSMAYINEKCRAGETRDYSEDTAREGIESMVTDFCYDYKDDFFNDEDFKESQYDEWRNELLEDVLGDLDFENEFTLHDSAYSLSVRVNDSIKFEIDTSDGLSCRGYTHRFNWCVLAMNKAAELYFSKDKNIEILGNK